MVTPFTDRVNALRGRGLRYADLEARCRRARSTAWFNILVNQGTWAVNPPPQSTWKPLAGLLEVSEDTVREMIAEQWYGVSVHDHVSARVKVLAPRLDALSDQDAALIDNLLQRLTSDGGASAADRPRAA